jgi:hypothetical protein
LLIAGLTPISGDIKINPAGLGDVHASRAHHNPKAF